MRTALTSFLLLLSITMDAQPSTFKIGYSTDSIRVTIDLGENYNPSNQTTIVLYALPNGNTTEQTIGKKLQEGDDWHFDIQHIGAQSKFIRLSNPLRNFVVIYLENNLRSWPAWKQRNKDFRKNIPELVDFLVKLVDGKRKKVYLNGHSGGGSFIFGYLAGRKRPHKYVRRISFLDSNYGYDSSYYPKLKKWLDKGGGRSLNVFAYNDSVVIYNGKPLVSPTGGTWYRSRLMRNHFEKDFKFSVERNDSLTSYVSANKRIYFFMLDNPLGKIYHTTQVELNGFIHSIFCGTRNESMGYKYLAPRAYESLVTP